MLLFVFWGGEEVAQGDAVEVAARMLDFAFCAAEAFGGWGITKGCGGKSLDEGVS